MKITTKFDIGQKVWRIAEGASGQWCLIDRKHPKQIDWIRTDNSRHYVSVEYELKKIYRSWDENCLFASKAEAQAACDKRSKE